MDQSFQCMSWCLIANLNLNDTINRRKNYRKMTCYLKKKIKSVVKKTLTQLSQNAHYTWFIVRPFMVRLRQLGLPVRFVDLLFFLSITIFTEH